MPKDHVAIRCPHCGGRMLIGWPTPRGRQLRIECSACEASFPLAEAVERTLLGAADDRDLHLVRKRTEHSG